MGAPRKDVVRRGGMGVPFSFGRSSGAKKALRGTSRGGKRLECSKAGTPDAETIGSAHRTWPWQPSVRPQPGSERKRGFWFIRSSSERQRRTAQDSKICRPPVLGQLTGRVIAVSFFFVFLVLRGPILSRRGGIVVRFRFPGAGQQAVRHGARHRDAFAPARAVVVRGGRWRQLGGRKGSRATHVGGHGPKALTLMTENGSPRG